MTFDRSELLFIHVVQYFPVFHLLRPTSESSGIDNFNSDAANYERSAASDTPTQKFIGPEHLIPPASVYSEWRRAVSFRQKSLSVKGHAIDCSGKAAITCSRSRPLRPDKWSSSPAPAPPPPLHRSSILLLFPCLLSKTFRRRVYF